MCCFQKVEQWEALKIHYPLLWEEMSQLAQTLEYKEYKGDSTRRRFLDYWRKQQPRSNFGLAAGYRPMAQCGWTYAKEDYEHDACIRLPSRKGLSLAWPEDFTVKKRATLFWMTIPA
jgi:hypothetical protein